MQGMIRVRDPSVWYIFHSIIQHPTSSSLIFR
jgi:hypothetical protein